MTVAPQSLKDPQVLLLREELKSANVAMDNIATEISKHVTDVELAKANADLPKEMLFDYSTWLSNLIDNGEALSSNF